MNTKVENELLKINSYFRSNKDIHFVAKSITKRFANLEPCIDELFRNLGITNAYGKWLDFIGAEVGAERDETDFGNYFCVNLSHCNLERNFYFLLSNFNPSNKLTLNDVEFLQKIYAYICKNSSCGRFSEFVRAIKLITGAKTVEFSIPEPACLKLNLIGENSLLTPSATNYIQKNNICEGIYIKEITINE